MKQIVRFTVSLSVVKCDLAAEQNIIRSYLINNDKKPVIWLPCYVNHLRHADNQLAHSPAKLQPCEMDKYGFPIR
jgi:hypothetical protein